MKVKTTCIVAAGLLLGACTTADQKADNDYWNKDYKSAYAEFLPLAQGGDWLADERLGYMYAHGLGVTQDMAQAQQWYEKAAMDGDVSVQNNLGIDALYSSPKGPDYAQAAKWFQMAANNGNPDAALQLSVLYEHGLGVTKDEDTAVHWLNQYVAHTHVNGQKIQYKFSSGGDNTGGFITAVQNVLMGAARRSPDAKEFSYLPVYLSFHYQEGCATEVKIVGSSGSPVADDAAVRLLQDTLLPPVLPSLSHDPNFTMPFALAQGMNGMVVIPSPSYRPAPPAGPFATFEAEVKYTITLKTGDKLREESKGQSGYVFVQFHYQDGKVTDAAPLYLSGDPALGQEVIQQLMPVQLPPPIPELAGKRVRFTVGFCFLAKPADCLEQEKRAAATVKPEPDDANLVVGTGG